MFCVGLQKRYPSQSSTKNEYIVYLGTYINVSLVHDHQFGFFCFSFSFFFGKFTDECKPKSIYIVVRW